MAATTINLPLCRVLTDLNVPEERAREAAEASVSDFSGLATKADLQAMLAGVEERINAEESIMHYEVEVNVGRKGGSPVWRSMVNNEGEEVATWADKSKLQAESADQGWPDFRVLVVDENGTKTVTS